jgi:ankyrin repeat protein
MVKFSSVQSTTKEIAVTMNTFDGPVVLSSTWRRMATALILVAALAGSSPVFCGPIHEAARDGDLKEVQLLLKAHPDLVSSKDEKYGQTPLHIAAFNDRVDVAKVLLANKADVNAKANNGSTPLHLAAAKGNKDMVELLLANKADVNAVDNDGWSPEHSAVVWEHKDIQDLLSQNGGKELPAPRPIPPPPPLPGAARPTGAAHPGSAAPTGNMPPAAKAPPTNPAPPGNSAPSSKPAPPSSTAPPGNPAAPK